MHLADLIRRVEENCPQIQIDIELNSLEDAFIKIAQDDIKTEQDKIQQQANALYQMSEQAEQDALDDYAKFEGNQSFCQKVYFIAQHRLKLFYRETSQWLALLVPIVFVTMMAYIFYSIVNVTARARENDLKEKEANGEELGER